MITSDGVFGSHTGQIELPVERFLDPLDLSPTSTWRRAGRNCLERGGTWKAIGHLPSLSSYWCNGVTVALCHHPVLIKLVLPLHPR